MFCFLYRLLSARLVVLPCSAYAFGISTYFIPFPLLAGAKPRIKGGVCFFIRLLLISGLDICLSKRNIFMLRLTLPDNAAMSIRSLLGHFLDYGVPGSYTGNAFI
jgi:hypothetical protein